MGAVPYFHQNCSTMIYHFLIIALTVHNVVSESMTFSKTTQISASGTTKTATCAITVSYSGSVVDAGASSVQCTIPWPKSKALSKSGSTWVVVGVLGNLVNVKVSFTLKKAKGKGASTTKTSSPGFAAQDYSSDSPASYPVDLWCPAEDTIIYTDGDNVVSQTSVDSWQNCAELCSTYTNEAGNAPCFSWTYNNAGVDMYGLPAGECRLLSYSSVFRMEATGVQSGYHKCWAAYQTYSP